MKSRNEKVFDLLYDNGLAWDVTKESLYAKINRGTDKEVREVMTDNYGTFRSDDGSHLGTVKDRYEIFQNKELAGTLVDACDGLDLEVKKGGTLQGGRKVFLQIVLPEAQVGNSGIKRYLTALNSHDGSSSIGFGTTNQVVFCSNTFHAAMKDVQGIRHTASYSDRVKDAIESIKQAMTGESLLMDNFNRMSDIKVEDDKFVIDLVSKVLNVKPDEKASTRKSNQVTQMAQDIRTDINQHGNNLWGLFNGITRFTNHSQVKSEKSLENVMVGQGARMNDIAFKEIMKQVEASMGASILV